MLDAFLSLTLELRAVWALQQLRQEATYGSIAYEYEKRSYPLAMADLVGVEATRLGDPEAAAALDFLQQLDPQANETCEKRRCI